MAPLLLLLLLWRWIEELLVRRGRNGVWIILMLVLVLMLGGIIC